MADNSKDKIEETEYGYLVTLSNGHQHQYHIKHGEIGKEEMLKTARDMYEEHNPKPVKE